MKITKKQLKNIIQEALEIGERFFPEKFTDWLARIKVTLPLDAETMQKVNDLVASNDETAIEHAVFLISLLHENISEEKIRDLIESYFLAKNPPDIPDISDPIPGPDHPDYLSGKPLSLSYDLGLYFRETYEGVDNLLEQPEIKSYINRYKIKIHRAIASDKLVLFRLRFPNQEDFELRIYGQDKKPVMAEIMALPSNHMIRRNLTWMQQLKHFVNFREDYFEKRLLEDNNENIDAVLKQLQNLRILLSIKTENAAYNFMDNPKKYLNKGDSFFRRIRPKVGFE